METVREILDKTLAVQDDTSRTVADRAKEIRTILERTIVALKGVINAKDTSIALLQGALARMKGLVDRQADTISALHQTIDMQKETIAIYEKRAKV